MTPAFDLGPTSNMLRALIPAGLYLLAALGALILEAAGTPEGARKKTSRAHLPWLIALPGVLVVGFVVAVWHDVQPVALAGGLMLDRVALMGSVLIAVLATAAELAAFPELQAIDEHRGERTAAVAAVAAGFSLLLVVNHIVGWCAALVVVQAGQVLLVAPDRHQPHGVEAAAKGLVASGLVLALGGLSAVFCQAASGDLTFVALGTALAAGNTLGLVAAALLIVALLIVIGAVPVHQGFVDVAHGASTTTSGFVAGGAFLTSGVVGLRVLDGMAAGGSNGADLVAIASLLRGLALVGLVAAPLAALDQVRIGRVVATMVAGGSALVLAAFSAGARVPSLVHGPVGHAVVVATFVGAFTGAAALLGLTLPRLQVSSTWEHWAGFGRERPVLAALVVYVLATLAGLPGTVGLNVRLEVARALFSAHDDVLGIAVIASVGVAVAPVVRFALFLFAKESRVVQRPAMGTSVRFPAFAFAALVTLAVLLTAWPALLDALVSSAWP